MPELTLAHEQRLSLRAQAHRLHPIVRLGAAGLSQAVLQEIDRALRSHGLIKVRAAGAQRAEREALSQAIADRLDAARVQVIGNIVVLYRPIPESPARAPIQSKGRAAVLRRSHKRPGLAEPKSLARRRTTNRRFSQR